AVRRGELWTASGGRHDASKPRPVLIVQDDRFDATDSITICPLTTDLTEIPLLRIPLIAAVDSGLAAPSRLMVDKLTTMPRSKLGERIGAVTDTDMVALSRALVVFLGLT
ncbi:MAG: type II toxin-antitoxin system PemK/MazF family toxin, partial [Sciscionella sp.]